MEHTVVIVKDEPDGYQRHYESFECGSLTEAVAQVMRKPHKGYRHIAIVEGRLVPSETWIPIAKIESKRIKSRKLKFDFRDIVGHSYFAGHFDAEGAVMCYPCSSEVYRISCSVCATDFGALALYRFRYGGNILLRKVDQTRKPLWVWRLDKENDVARFLRSIAPYSMERRSRINMALDLLRIKRNQDIETKDGHVEFKSFSSSVLANRIKSMNQRGADYIPQEKISDGKDLGGCYFAGHFDGEGCVSIGVCRGNKTVRCEVETRCKPLLEKYVRCWGGRIRHIPKRRAERADTYAWRLSKKDDVERFITSLLPFSYIKVWKMIEALSILRGKCCDYTKHLGAFYP